MVILGVRYVRMNNYLFNVFRINVYQLSNVNSNDKSIRLMFIEVLLKDSGRLTNMRAYF